MTPVVAEEFWIRVINSNADTESERRQILFQMVKEGKILSVSETSRTKEQYIKDMSKEFKVLDLTRKQEDDMWEVKDIKDIQEH